MSDDNSGTVLIKTVSPDSTGYPEFVPGIISRNGSDCLEKVYEIRPDRPDVPLYRTGVDNINITPDCYCGKCTGLSVVSVDSSGLITTREIYSPADYHHLQDNNTSSGFQGARSNKKKKGKMADRLNKQGHLVAKRNARERRRVQAVNTAFSKLRKALPLAHGRSKRISKVRTLQGAIDYIDHLQQMLNQ